MAPRTWDEYPAAVSGFEDFRDTDGTAWGPAWSLADYLRWQRAEEDRDEAAREAMNIRIIARFGPECEAVVRALEECGWGRQEGSEGKR